jgi:hypothetical protein
MPMVLLISRESVTADQVVERRKAGIRSRPFKENFKENWNEHFALIEELIERMFSRPVLRNASDGNARDEGTRSQAIRQIAPRRPRPI